MVTILQKQTEIITDKFGHPVNASTPIDSDISKTKISLQTAGSQEDELKLKIFDTLTDIEMITMQVLAKNPILRLLRYRNFVSKIVADIYGKEISNETVPRVLRRIQNEYNLYKVDETNELEQIYREYFGVKE